MSKLYKHYKGGIYEVICFAVLKNDKQPMVVYKDIKEGFIWIRPVDEFVKKFKQIKEIDND